MEGALRSRTWHQSIKPKKSRQVCRLDALTREQATAARLAAALLPAIISRRRGGRLGFSVISTNGTWLFPLVPQTDAEP